jgi:hypothetical protein
VAGESMHLPLLTTQVSILIEKAKGQSIFGNRLAAFDVDGLKLMFT